MKEEVVSVHMIDGSVATVRSSNIVGIMRYKDRLYFIKLSGMWEGITIESYKELERLFDSTSDPQKPPQTR